MSGRTRFVLVRHGQTDANAGGIFQGQADVPLNRVGRAQAAAVAAQLAPLRPDRVVTSDLSRASETADAIARACGRTALLDRRLREIDVGSWQGLTREQVAEDNPWLDGALLAGQDFRRSPTGETATEAGERVRQVLLDLAERFPGSTSVVVGHGLALRTGLILMLGLGLAEGAVLAGLWNCSWSVVENLGRWRLVSYNNVA